MSSDSTYIAVGVDGEAGSAHAAQWAAGWASQLGLSLKIITADRTSGDQDALRARLDSIVEEARKAVSTTYPDLPVEVEASIDNPVSAMIDESETAAVVVIGTRGTGGWRGTGMHSVAGAVAAASKCPTVVVPPAAPAAYDPTGDLVVGHDGGEGATRAAEETLARAARQGRKVRVVQAGAAEQYTVVEAAVEKLRAAYPSVTIDFVHGPEDAEDLLTRESETASALVVATKGHRGVPGFLPGPTTLHLMQHSRSPVVVHSETNEKLAPS